MARGIERQESFLERAASGPAPATFLAMKLAWQRYVEAHHQRFLPAARRTNGGTVQPALSRLNPLYQDLQAATRRFALESELEENAALDAVAATYHGSRQVIVAATLASLLVSAAIGFVLAEAAHRAQQAAEAASAAKSLFLATMSHELRTPLNAMLGYAQLLQLEARASGQQGIGEDLDRLVGAGRHLTAVINNILDFSKIEQGKVEVSLEPVALEGLLREVAALLLPAAAERGNRLELALGPGLGSLETDPAKLRQILFNLLANAVKFTEAGRIVLRAERPDDAVELAVEDSGIGIAAEHLQLDLPALRAGRRLDHPALRRHRPRPGGESPAGRDARRRGHRREPAGRRLDFSRPSAGAGRPSRCAGCQPRARRAAAGLADTRFPWPRS